MKAKYTLREDAVIHRIVMRLEKIDRIDINGRFDGRSIILNSDDAKDRKVMIMLNELDLIETIELVA